MWNEKISMVEELGPFKVESLKTDKFFLEKDLLHRRQTYKWVNLLTQNITVRNFAAEIVTRSYFPGTNN